MSMPNRRPRALRPAAESLETRKLLTVTKTITGRDADGDSWVLRLLGPGDLEVLKQPDADGFASPLDSATQIDLITVGGGNPESTRLVGKVTKGPGGDGRVYFHELTEVGGRALTGTFGNGVQSIDMPGFWLGNTSGAAISTDNPAPSMNIPDGVITLKFGGVDTTFGPQGVASGTTAPAPNNIVVSLGLPQVGGTSVIVDKVISSSTPNSASTTGDPVRNGVIFVAGGRLNLFQANEIVGDKADPTSGFQGGGGTMVVSLTDAVSGVTGQIGNVRVGGDATNFSTQVAGSNALISNFYVGGETQNVLLLAPNGARNLSFGKGMDTVQIYAHTIENLQANRGALDSQVISSRSIGRVQFGGDVVNTQVLSGYLQDLGGAFENQQTPSSRPAPQVGGGMTALVAGDVVNSVFTASVDPVDGVFGFEDLEFPQGQITAKIEGTINNATATPDAPGRAFFAETVNLSKGPVAPPSVPEAPFQGKDYGRGQASLFLPTTLNRPGPRGPRGLGNGSGGNGSTGGGASGGGTANQRAGF